MRLALLLAAWAASAGDPPAPVADAAAAAKSADELIERARPLISKDPAAARALLEAAQDLSERQGDRPGRARALHAIGQVESARDDLEPAEASFRESLALREELGDDAGRGETLGQLGVLQSKRGDYDGALAFYREALPLVEAAGNRVETAAVLNNIGNAHNGLGQHDEALAFYTRSAEAARAANAQARLAIALNNIGLVHQKQGDYAGAVDHFQRSIAIKQELGNRPGVGISLENIGEVYRLQGNDALALEFFEKALEIFVAADVKSGIGMTLANMGAIYHARGEVDRALQYGERALAQFEAIEDRVGMAEGLVLVGQALELRGELVPALARYQEGLRFAEETGDRVRIGQALLRVAEVRVRRGEAALALPLVERAVAVAGESGNRETLWRARNAEGHALLALGRRGEAQGAFEASVSVIEGMRGQVAGGETESARAFEDKVAPYTAMAALLAAAGDTQAALGYAERAKGRVLLDVLLSGRASATHAMTPAEREREAALEKALVALNTQIAGESARKRPDASRLAELRSGLEAARRDHEAFRTGLYVAHPELKVRRGEAPALSREDLEALVPDAETALLEYVVDERAGLLFVATRPARDLVLRSYAVALGRAALLERVGAFREQIAGRDLGFAAEARGLHELLLAPAAAQLQGKTRLVVVPDGVLWELPFQALQTKPGRFLVEGAAVSYAPSLTVLREMRRAARPTSPRETLLALGNPVIGSGVVGRSQAVLMGPTLEPLPEAERQVRALGALYGAHGVVHVGDAATEARLKAAAGRYRVFHVATHGVLSDASPMYSHLVLSPQPPDDGLLEARELLGLDLDADLAVLSACETGRGRIGAGEGVIGLTWALFVAGCPRTVVSQWKVESSSTTALMLAFHRKLKPRLEAAGGSPATAEALRAAAREVMREPRYRHPFYWAGFVVVGDGS